MSCLAAKIDYVPSSAEMDAIRAAIEQTLGPQISDGEIDSINSFADVGPGGFRSDVVGITYEPHRVTEHVRHRYSVTCVREPSLSENWECLSDLYRKVRTSANQLWIHLLSADEPLIRFISDADGLEMAARLASTERLRWADQDVDILIKDLSQIALWLFKNQCTYFMEAVHKNWGAITIQLERGPGPEELRVVEGTPGSVPCDDGDPRYGSNPRDGGAGEAK